MRDDLIERLRQIRGTQFTPLENALVTEAADRIAKLESALLVIEQDAHVMLAHGIRDMARAALSTKESRHG